MTPKNILATVGITLGLGLLLSLRFVGQYSHQAFTVVLALGLVWAIVSRFWLHRKNSLQRGLLDADNRPHLVQAVGRASFWGALGLAAVVVFPRSAEMWWLIGLVVVIAVLRVGLSFVVPRRTNLAGTALMVVAALVLFVDVGRCFAPTAEPAVTLRPPFDGKWLVIQGGPSPMQNHHLTAYNQEYALDLMKLTDDGKLFVEGEEGNAANASWEQPLFAPVDGRVVDVRNDVQDSEGLNLVADPELASGNHVVIETSSGEFVVLAHLRHESVSVAEGDVVSAGDPVGLCGNSGNTTTPHLHLQVQTHGGFWDPDNRSLPFGFGEGVQVRNDRIAGQVRR